MFGFLVLWVLLAIVGTFIRGPGWMWFWPGMTWDPHRQVHETNLNLHEIFGITDPLMVGVFGGIATIGGLTALFGIVDIAIRKRPDIFRSRTSCSTSPVGLVVDARRPHQGRLKLVPHQVRVGDGLVQRLKGR
jgi:hypothetical protein